MIRPNPEVSQLARRRAKRLAILAALAAAALLILLLALLLRRWGSQPEPWLRLSPAASPVDDATSVALSGGGWQPGERVAVCLTPAGDERCDDGRALAIEAADREGAIRADIAAGPQLAQGQTTFTVLGLDSGRRASRSFRVLKSPAAPGVAGSAEAGSPGGTTELELTGIDQPTAQPPAGGGWNAEYFANTDLLAPAVLAREDREIAFDWGAGSPDPQLPPDGFSVRWTRNLAFPGATHRFLVQADGGVRLFVNDQLLIDQWQDQGLSADASASIDLAPGVHTVRLEYVDQQGNASVALQWESVDFYPDWRGEYFTNPDLAGQPALVRNDPDPDLDWGDGSPAPGVIPADGFSARWTRTLNFAPGVYRFVLTADDGARLLLDGQPVIDAWQERAGETVTVDRELAGGDYQVVVVFRDLAGPARIAAGWSPVPAATPVQIAGGAPTPTPDSAPTPTVAPGDTPLPTATPAASTPAATETASPSSSVTAEPTATAGTPGAATSTATASVTPDGDATATPTATPSPTVSVTPGAIQRRMDINPIMGYAGTRITITSGNWSPGTPVRVALLEVNAPFSQAQNLDIPPFTTPSDSSQSFSLSFDFPDDSRWLSQTFVRVLLHNGNWSEWAEELFDVIPE